MRRVTIIGVVMYQLDLPGLNSLGIRCLGTSSKLLGLVYMETTCEDHDNNKNAWEAKREVSVTFFAALRVQGNISALGSLEPTVTVGVGAGLRCLHRAWGHLQLWVEGWEPSNEWGSWLNLFLHLWNEGWALTTHRSIINFPLLLFYTEGTEAENETMS